MTHMFDPDPITAGTIVNVSRRLLLKGVVASGTLVLGASSTARPRGGRLGDRRGRDAGWNGE